VLSEVSFPTDIARRVAPYPTAGRQVLGCRLGGVMTTYRLYGCDDRGRIQFGDFIEAADEAGARELARTYLDRFPIIEVWIGDVRLFRVERI
jgi:hypothetical protein